MKNKLINLFLVIIFIIFFVHLLKDITQDILKIKTPLDYIGDLKEVFSSFSKQVLIIYYIFGILSILGEVFLVILIPLLLFKKRKNLLKPILIITAFLIVYFLVVYSMLFLNPSNFYFSTPNKEFINYSINNIKYKLLVADEQNEWQKGLMFYRSKNELKGADGMIFIFPDKQIRNFWNKNTYLDLDVYWLDNDEVVGKNYLPSIEKSKEVIVVESKVKINKVIELIR
ncbi:DUF192 domain-containing protein [Candidatus Roizmanbacteria bacterium]|nr:DUF192 domain-containing protein [Candidatus Roizmanbacteria bacterium]